MTVFGIGTLELMLILLLLILIFGPDRIVEMGQWLGRSYRKLTGVTDEINQQVSQVRKAIDTTAGVGDVARPFKETAKDLDDVQRDIGRDLSAPAAAIPGPKPKDEEKSKDDQETEAS